MVQVNFTHTPNPDQMRQVIDSIAGVMGTVEQILATPPQTDDRKRWVNAGMQIVHDSLVSALTVHNAYPLAGRGEHLHDGIEITGLHRQLADVAELAVQWSSDGTITNEQYEKIRCAMGYLT